MVFLFLLLFMPRWAPWLIGLLRRTTLLLEAALLVAVREPEARRTEPEAFLTVLFFTRLRVRPATAHAWATRSLIRIPRKSEKISSPAGAPSDLFFLGSYITHFRRESKP